MSNLEVNAPSSKDLLGYLLGALEADEHQEIEQLVEQDHELKEELQNAGDQVAVLDQLDPPGIPPAGLARRTCEFVAANTATITPSPDNRADRAPSTGRRWFAGTNEHSGGGRRSVTDFAMLAVVLLLMASIILPILNNNRFQSRVLACQGNLQEVGRGLLQYAENSGGRFVEMPESGNLSFAGIYAPSLKDGGLVEDPSSFMCPANSTGSTNYIPTLDEIMNAEGKVLTDFQRTAGGDFAYTMGQMRDGRYFAGENNNRAHFILLADNPSASLPGRASKNHGGHGQNVFFEDGHIRFLESPEFNEDSIYENDWGVIAPGVTADDIVLAPSATRFINFRVD